jgi:hypothetical protein
MIRGPLLLNTYRDAGWEGINIWVHPSIAQTAVRRAGLRRGRHFGNKVFQYVDEDIMKLRTFIYLSLVLALCRSRLSRRTMRW